MLHALSGNPVGRFFWTEDLSSKTQAGNNRSYFENISRMKQ